MKWGDLRRQIHLALRGLHVHGGHADLHFHKPTAL